MPRKNIIKSLINKRKPKRNKLYNQKAISTNIIKEAFEDIYLHVKNQFIAYKEDEDIILKKKFIDDTMITYNTNFSKYKNDLIKMKPNNKLIKEVNLLDPSRFPIKDKYIPKHKRIITGLDITNEISFNTEDCNFNTPIIIYYKEKPFRISGNNYVNQYECTWKCQNIRKKNKYNNNNKFCDATIRGKRNEYLLNKFNFYLKKLHSDICIKHSNGLEQKNIEYNNKIDTESEVSNNNTRITQEIMTNNPKTNKKIYTLKQDLEEDLKKFIIINKNNKLSLKKFIQYGESLVDQIKIKNFSIKDYYFKNTYYKIIKNLFPINSDDMYKYANKLPNNEDFARSYFNTIILTNDNKKLEHKHMIFFSDYDIKRFIASENILLDGTFSYPKGYEQTLILMYMDVIVLKMIPGIFIISNNKTYEGYKLIFNDLLNKINIFTKINKSKLKIKTVTTDFEVALYTAFKEIFIKEVPNLHHIGCYYHYIYNIRKQLMKLGYGKKKKN